MAVDKSDELLTQLTTSIVSAYITKNRVPQTQLAAVIASVAQSISKLGTEAAPIIDTPTPAVPIRKSVTHEFLISLEDGKQYRMLKRHLSRLGLTRDTYRAKWGLPKDYPMVAAGFSEKRSALAKQVVASERANGQLKRNAKPKAKARA